MGLFEVCQPRIDTTHRSAAGQREDLYAGEFYNKNTLYPIIIVSEIYCPREQTANQNKRENGNANNRGLGCWSGRQKNCMLLLVNSTQIHHNLEYLWTRRNS